MTTATDTCWADPLTRAERKVLREKLARACMAFWDEAAPYRCIWPEPVTDREVKIAHSLIMTSAEMSDLHLDVTERAEVPS